MFEHSDVQRYGAAIEGRSLADAQKWAHELVIALTVYPISVRHNYFAGNWHICVGQADPVKLDLQISLSEEVPRFLSRFQVALQVAAPWEDRSPKLLKTAEVAQNRVADVSRNWVRLEYSGEAFRQAQRFPERVCPSGTEEDKTTTNVIWGSYSQAVVVGNTKMRA
jgi:hypothetical protein